MKCSMGVGCEENGQCYADAHDEPERCGRQEDTSCGEPIPEHTRQALLMVLYCHQGARSRIGQEVRFILGKGQYESMTPDEVRIAGECFQTIAEARSLSRY